jgi:hypothetical protein
MLAITTPGYDRRDVLLRIMMRPRLFNAVIINARCQGTWLASRRRA